MLVLRKSGLKTPLYANMGLFHFLKNKLTNGRLGGKRKLWDCSNSPKI